MEPQFVILELLGRRQRAGWLSEEKIAETVFLRLDIPQQGDPPTRCEWYATAAVYAIHPTDEEAVRKFNRPLGLPALPVSERQYDPDGIWEDEEEDTEEEGPDGIRVLREDVNEQEVA